MKTYRGIMVPLLFLTITGMSCADDSLPITSPRNLTYPAASTLAKPANDNARIAFASDRETSGFNIYLMKASGHDVRQLTSGTPPESSRQPDRREILYASGTDRQIHVVRADGRHDHVLTRDPRGAENPAWSPNGEKIAFTGFRDNLADVWENSEIYVINPDGSGCKRLTNNPAIDAQPSWADEGARIAFVSTRNGNHEIYAMTAGGNDQRRLTDNPASDADPAWAK